MLKKYLDEAIAKLDELINLTELDIENIKQAKHSTVDESVKKKTSLIKEFEAVKKSLDKELARVSKEYDTTALAGVLDDEAKAKLVLMRQKLENLHDINKQYARHVVAVKEFFDTLSKKVFNLQNNGYDANASETNLYKARV